MIFSRTQKVVYRSDSRMNTRTLLVTTYRLFFIPVFIHEEML